MRKNRLFSMFFSAALLLTGCASSEAVPAETPQTAVPKTSESQTAASKTATAEATTALTAAETAAPETTAPPETRNLVTLGDSISYGYGLENSETQRYSYLLAQKLSQLDHAVWEDNNYAVSGDTSSDLLYRLKNGRAQKLPYADAVVICIGGNNLLQPYKNYLQTTVLNAQKHFEDLKGLKMDSINDYTKDDLNSLGSTILDSLKDTGIDYERLQANLDKSLTQFRSDLDDIYSYIRDKNKDAEIYVLNVYNPYKNLTEVKLPGMEEPINVFGQKKLDQLNGILSEWEQSHSDLHAVDLAAEYAKYEKPPVIGKNGLKLSGTEENDTGIPEALLIDPHPNAEGQRIISDLLLRNMRP